MINFRALFNLFVHFLDCAHFKNIAYWICVNMFFFVCVHENKSSEKSFANSGYINYKYDLLIASFTTEFINIKD